MNISNNCNRHILFKNMSRDEHVLEIHEVYIANDLVYVDAKNYSQDYKLF